MEPERIVAWGRELRAVHSRLRDALALASESVDDTADLLLYCHGFCAALDGHHRSEDRGLFPQLAAARPDLVPVLEKLTQDHSMIEYLVAGLRDALAAGITEEERIRHLEGIGAIMENHFAYEERQLIDVLDASASLAGTREDLLGPL